MLLIIIFMGAGLSLVIANYFNGKRESRQEEKREKRRDQYEQLLKSLKKKDEDTAN